MSNKAKIREDAMKLNPIDDVMFVKMAEDLGFCEEMLQVLLSDKDLQVLENHHQHVVKNLQGRSCILDLKCRLGTGQQVLVEVQKADDDDHQRRMRYESSVLTANITDPGIKYEKVPDIIAIFISRFDIFEQEHTIYHIERVIKETGLVVENGLVEVYANAKIDDGTDIAAWMKVLSENDIYDDKFPKLSSRKKIFKTTEEGVSQMCDIIEKNRKEAAEEAAKEAAIKAKAEERINSVRTLIKAGLTNLIDVKKSGLYTPQELAAIEAN